MRLNHGMGFTRAHTNRQSERHTTLALTNCTTRTTSQHHHLSQSNTQRPHPQTHDPARARALPPPDQCSCARCPSRGSVQPRGSDALESHMLLFIALCTLEGGRVSALPLKEWTKSLLWFRIFWGRKKPCSQTSKDEEESNGVWKTLWAEMRLIF